MRENSRQLLEQTAINLEDYLRSMRRISDAMYYSVIKDKDLEQEGMDEEMTLLYEANKDKMQLHPATRMRVEELLGESRR